MTIREVIGEADAIEPNAYTDAQKAKWILHAEGRVGTDIFLMRPEDMGSSSAEADGYGRRLLTPAPFDRLYPLYLQAMIQSANGEYERYQNTMQMYNEAFGAFLRWFAAECEPALTKKSCSISFTASGTAWEVPEGIYGAFRAEPGADFSGSITAKLNGETVLSFSGGTAQSFPCRLTEGGRLEFSGGYAGEFRMTGRLYRYGWPDEYGRM